MIAEARAGRPVVVEAKTYRYRGHSVSDPGTTYRTREEVESYKKLDPIGRIQNDILEQSWASEQELEAMNDEIVEEVMASVAYAEESPIPPMGELTRHVLAE